MTTSDVHTDRQGLEVLGYDACAQLLDEQAIGRVAFVHEGEPVVIPVNYAWHRKTIVFRTATGAKLDAAIVGRVAAFEIDGWDEVYHRGWSVLVRGWIEEVTDDAEVAELEALPLRPWAQSIERPYWVRLIPDEISGRRII